MGFVWFNCVLVALRVWVCSFDWWFGGFGIWRLCCFYYGWYVACGWLDGFLDFPLGWLGFLGLGG